ncbi:hypothetical protein [Nocardia brevicatena]|uniref:hypothetical protein n=1 Tax=Nocardia brevicatena TaxID=37327 RepID=UPI0003049393|nr:hypothetical protein [Nocardia brevicatena]
MDIKSFVVDVAVSAGVTAIMPGGALIASFAGGAVGGVAGYWSEHGFSLSGDALTAAFAGGVGGVAGRFLGGFFGRRMTESVTKAAERVAKAGEPEAAREAAEAAVKSGETAKKNATDALKKWQRKNSGTLNGKQQNKLNDLRGNIDDAKDELRRLRQELSDAKSKEQQGASELAAAKKSKEAKDGWNKRLFAKGDKVEWYHKIVPGSFVGLGSALAVLGWESGYNPFNGDEQGGDKPPGAVQAVPLKWAGLEAATQAGLMWQDPFKPDPAITAQGLGFLVHPVELAPHLATWYGGPSQSFASSLVDYYQLFGDPKNKKELQPTPPPKIAAAPAGLAQGSKTGAGYAEAVKAINDATDALKTSDARLLEVITDTEKISRQGQEDIGNLIRGVNRTMVEIPDKEDVTFLELATPALSELIQLIEKAIGEYQRTANGVPDPTAGDKKATEDLNNSVNRFADSTNDPSLWPKPPNSGLTDPSDIKGLTPPGVDETGTNPADLDKAIDRLDRRASDPAVNPPPTPGMNTPGAIPAVAPPPVDTMGPLLSSLLPSMLMGNTMGDDLAGSRYLDPARYERDRAATAPPPVAPPAATTPWSAQSTSPAATPAATPAAATPSGQTHGTPPTGASTSPAGGPPPRTPNADGSVLYTFPDGRTQKVSPTVAQVLDKAFANIQGTDAQAAYADTKAKWKDKKEIGDRVDPYQLMTGDVATWDDRTAILVAFGSGEEGTLEAVVNGELKKFTPEMSDSAGEFGQFTGFRHPPGIELAASNGKDDTAKPVDDQQSTVTATDAPLAVAPA